MFWIGLGTGGGEGILAILYSGVSVCLGYIKLQQYLYCLEPGVVLEPESTFTRHPVIAVPSPFVMEMENLTTL